MDIYFKTAPPEETALFAQLVLLHKLHNKKESAIKPNCNTYIALTARFNRYHKKTFTWTRASVKHTRPKNVITLAFTNDGAPVGCFLLHGFYSHFYVKPEYRNKGIASAMFSHAANAIDLTGDVLNYGNSKGAHALVRKFNLSARICEMRTKVTLLDKTASTPIALQR